MPNESRIKMIHCLIIGYNGMKSYVQRIFLEFELVVNVLIRNNKFNLSLNHDRVYPCISVLSLIGQYYYSRV